MNDLYDKYENKHLQNIARAMRIIKALYYGAIDDITLTSSTITLKGNTFSLNQYPSLQNKVEQVLSRMQASIYTAVVNSIAQSWGLSNEKNNILVDRRLVSRRPTAKARTILYDPNKNALDAFIQRKEKGRNLSKRVWNTLEPFKAQLEQGLGIGISEGKAAKEMAKDLKQYLNQPDKLFRKVRDSKGVLQLSKAAKEYRPGQGVYRSSYKNALRLTVSETNIAYRTADHERWKAMPFVKGVRVKLSNAHPKFDLCDSMAGLYPKDYKFTGWHPFCICFAVPELVSDEEYSKMEDYTLGLTDKPPSIKEVRDIPASAKEWIGKNKERVQGWKNKPYWVKDNKEFVNL